MIMKYTSNKLISIYNNFLISCFFIGFSINSCIIIAVIVQNKKDRMIFKRLFLITQNEVIICIIGHMNNWTKKNA